MNSCRRSFLFGLASVLLAVTSTCPAQTNAGVDFRELYDLLRTNLVGATEATLNRAAAQGLLEHLRPRVALVAPASAAHTNVPTLAASSVYEQAFAYLRVGRVQSGLAQALEQAYRQLASTNRLRGLVLDLRFAEGEDYAAAAAAADRFLTAEKPLLDWGQGLVNSTVKTEAIPPPIAVLVNAGTSGAAEALAAVLRQHGLALLLGNPTAGSAAITREFTLRAGGRVRVAVAPVKLAQGETLPSGGLTPDIRVEVNADDERAWLQDAYLVLPKAPPLAAVRPTDNRDSASTPTNRPPRRRMNEADLLRMLREGQPLDADTTNVVARDSEPAQPVLRDPVLLRALDLLKALAVLKKTQPVSP